MTAKRHIEDFALVVDWRFHRKRRWVSACTYYLVEAIVERFSPVIISSQRDYRRMKRKIRNILSMEPGWAAPKIKYDRTLTQRIGVIVSDPHSKTGWFEDYVVDNCIDHVLSYYHGPFHHHLKRIAYRFVHFPWAIPDAFVSNVPLAVRHDHVDIFGGKASRAYNTRNWCRRQPGVRPHDFSGVENKKMTDAEYFDWLCTLDAAVAAGSEDPAFQLVTPKYFEIPAAGALLFAQYCPDLELLGFNDENCVIFEQQSFNGSVAAYRRDPSRYLEMRRRGRALIAARHLISHRLEQISALFNR